MKYDSIRELIEAIMIKKIMHFILLLLSCSSLYSAEDIPGIDIHSRPAEEVAHNEIPRNTLPVKAATNVHVLDQGTTKLLRSNGRNRLEIFCYEGEPKSLVNILKTIEVVVNVPNDNFQYYVGGNVSTVISQHKDSSWLNFVLWKSGTFIVNIHQSTCIGIETVESFKAELKTIYFDLWRVVALIIGLILFLLAPLLSQNVLFHYATGISVGVFGSLLVVVLLLSRLVPKKSAAFGVILGGWSIVLYLFQYFWQNSIALLQEYQSIVIGYIVIAGLVSFIIVYRFGPVSDTRSLNLVQWSLQLCGLGMVFISSGCKEFSLGMCIILIVQQNIPSTWKARFRTYWLRYFPPSQKLLSEDDYFEQSRLETTKALNNLREYCHSPDCNAWKTMARLKSPKRFAEFVEGQSHLVDEEILSYESAEFSVGEFTADLLTDDDDSSTE